MKLAVASLMLVSLALAVVIARPWRSRGGDTVQADAATTRPAQSPLGVEELMRHVDQHKGSVSVVGVVGAASADKQLVTLIDSKEFAACNDTGCAELVLPVRWTGAMPAARTTVRVDGQVRESDGKLVFVASAVREMTK